MLHYLLSIFVFIALILLVIGVHELGHFIAAKSLKIPVLRFSVGFGKALFRLKDKQGTDYIIAMIPLGGYVKLLDERDGDVSISQRHLAFNRQPFWKKFIVLIAGVTLNMLIAIMAYWLMFIIGFTTIIPVIGKVIPHSISAQGKLQPQQRILQVGNYITPEWRSATMALFRYYGSKDLLKVTVQDLRGKSFQIVRYLPLQNWKMNELTPDPLLSLGIIPFSPDIPPIIKGFSSASADTLSKLKIGDQILTINKNKIHQWQDLITYIQDHPSQTVTMRIKRNNLPITVQIFIGKKSFSWIKRNGSLGILSYYQWPHEFLTSNKYPLFQALSRAYQETLGFLELNLIILGKLIAGKISLQSLGGPIAIFLSTETAVGLGFTAILNLLAFINLSIAIANLLPIPGLDGGQIIVSLIECLRKKPLSMRVQLLFFRLGIILILMIFFIAFSNDILRLALSLF